MRVFLDFEASSLRKMSYPIEVGWVFEDGRSEGHLIRPARAWTDWDPTAEAVHHITREELLAQGEQHDRVARRMMAALQGHQLYASAPSWDGKWLSVLLRAAGLPRHGLRLADTWEAQLQAAREALATVLAPGELEAAAQDVVKTVEREPRAPAHRALADAEQELAIWRQVKALAETRAALTLTARGRTP